MKIAAVSDDGATISKHFGRAPLYIVLTVENGNVVKKETRPKAGHQTFATTDHHHAPGECHGHGYDATAQARHRSMADTIADCKVLLAGGMGRGAYESLRSYNVEPIITDVDDIDQAAQLYVAGKLANLMDRLH